MVILTLLVRFLQADSVFYAIFLCILCVFVLELYIYIYACMNITKKNTQHRSPYSHSKHDSKKSEFHHKKDISEILRDELDHDHDFR